MSGTLFLGGFAIARPQWLSEAWFYSTWLLWHCNECL